jgi:TP901 family phage tail tape measure protein
MADLKEILTVDIDVLAGVISTGELIKQGKKAIDGGLENLNKAIAQSVYKPEVMLDVTFKNTDTGKLEKKLMGVTDTIKLVQKSLKSSTNELTEEARDAIAAYYSDLENATQLLSKKYTPKIQQKLAQDYGDILGGKEISQFSKKQQKQLNEYIAVVEASNQAIVAAVGKSKKIYNTVGKDKIRLLPFFDVDLDQQTKEVRDSISKYRKLTGEVTQVRRKTDAENREYRQRLIKGANDLSKAGENFNFGGLSRAYRKEINALQKELDAAPLKKKGGIDDRIKLLEDGLKRVGNRYKEVFGSTLGKSIEEATMQSTDAESRYRDRLKEMQKAGPDSPGYYAARNSASRELRTSLTQAYAVQRVAGTEQEKKDAADRVNILERERVLLKGWISADDTRLKSLAKGNKEEEARVELAQKYAAAEERAARAMRGMAQSRTGTKEFEKARQRALSAAGDVKSIGKKLGYEDSVSTLVDARWLAKELTGQQSIKLKSAQMAQADREKAAQEKANKEQKTYDYLQSVRLNSAQMAQADREKAAREQAKIQAETEKWNQKVRLESARMAQADREKIASDTAKAERQRQKDADRIRNLNNALQLREDNKRLNKQQKQSELDGQLAAAQGSYKNFSLRGFMSSATPGNNNLLSQLEVARTLLNRRGNESLGMGLTSTAESFKELSLNVGDAINELKKFQSQAEKDGVTLSKTQESLYNKHYRRRGEIDRLRAGKEIYQRVGMKGIGYLDKKEMEYVRDYVGFAQKAGRIRQTQISNMDIPAMSKRSMSDSIAAEIADLSKAQRIIQSEMRGNLGLLREAGRAVNSFFKYALIYGGLYRVSGEMAKLVGNTVRFQDALKGIQAVSQATDAQMVRLAGSIRDVASNSSFSMAEIADAAQTLAQAGTDISKIPGALQAVNNFALATGGSLQTSADVLASAQNIFPNQNFNQLSDQLTGTVNVSKLSTEDLKTIFNLAAQTAASSGISSQQLLGASATLSNLGIKSSTIATGLRELILEIFSPDKQAIDFLKKRYTALGENLGEAQIKAVFRGFQNSDNPLQNAFAELRRLGVTGAARNDFRRIYETRAENVALPLISRPEALSTNIASVGQIGAAADGARVRLDSLAASLKTLGNELEMTTEAIIGGALETLKSTSDEASDLLKSFRDRVDERQIQGQSISSKVLPTIAAGAAAATSNSFGPVGKVVAGLTGGLAGFAGSTAAEGFGSSASAITNWVITVFGLIQLLGGNRVKSWNDKIGKVKLPSLGGVGNNVGVISSVGTAATQLLFNLGLIGSALKKPLTLLKLAAAGLSKIGWVGGIITVASGLWELYQVMSDLDPKEQIDALRRKVANLEGEAQKTQEAFANFDPQADNSMAQQVQKTKDAVLKYQETLKGIFGANATEAEKLLQTLGDVGLEAGTPQANDIKAKLSKLTDGGINERQMAKLVEAQNLFSQAQGDLMGKAGVILQRAVQLYQKPKDQLTEEEKSFLAAFEKAKGTSAFSGIAEGANKLVEKSDEFLKFIAEVFNGQSGEVERAKDKAKAELTRAEVGSSIDTGNSAAVEAQILQLLNAPTADNKRKLEELRKGLLERQQAGEIRTGNVVTSRTAGAGEAVRLGDLIDQRMPNYQKALDEQAKIAEESAKQAKDQAAKDEADKERFSKEEEALRARREELLRGRVENEKRAIQKEEEIIKAREAQEFESIAKEGGLLDQKYAYKQQQLKFEEDQAQLEFRKLAAEANIQPTDTKTIFGVGNEKIAQAYERWQDAQLKSFELGKQLAQEKLSARNSIRPEAYSPNAAAEANAKEIKKLNDELNDTEKENIAEVEQKYNSIRDLTLANLDMEIAFLKTQEGKYKPGDRDKYLRDLANLEQERRDADTAIEKRKNDRVRVLRDRVARQEIAALEEEYARLKKQVELAGNTPSTTRAQTLQVMRLPQGMTPSTPASMSGGSASGLSQNAQAAYQYFVQKGLKPFQAAGIVGNLMQESYGKVDPTTTNARGAMGIAQWLYPSRKQRLLSKADPYDFQTQLDYIWEEYNSTMRGAKKKMLGTQDVVGATDSFLWDFENPGKGEANREKRLANARKVLAAMQGQGAAYGYRASPASTSTGMISWEDMSKAIDSDGLYKGDVFGTDAFKKNAPEVYQAIIGGAMKWQQEQGGKAKVVIRDLGRNGGKANHKNGFAGDVQLMDKNGRLLDNIMAGGETFRAYEQFWQDGMAYAMKYFPEMENYFRAGMYFGDGTPLDLMHGDVTQKYLGKVKAPDSNGGNLRTGANAYLRGKFSDKKIVSQGIPNGDWNAYRQARFGEGISAGTYGIDMPVIGGDPGNQAQIVDLSQRMKEVSDRIAAIALENAKQSPTSKEDMARILQEYETRSFDRIKTEQDAVVDGIQSQLESQNRLLAQTEALGLLQGPSYTATREAADMANAPSDELGRLQRLESVYLQNAQVYYAAATDLTAQIKAISEQEASLLQLQAELKTKVASGIELTPEEQATLSRVRGELDALSRGKKEFQAKLREVGQSSAEEQRALATNRQNQMNYNFSLFGTEQQVPVYNPDGSPVTRQVIGKDGKPQLDSAGNPVTERLEQVTKTLGQLEQVDFSSIAGGVNELSYSFNKLGKNINNFITNVIDTFVTKLAESIMSGFDNTDKAALNQTRAELNAAIAEASYQQAVNREQLNQANDYLDRNPNGVDSGIAKDRRDRLQAAYQDSVSARNQAIQAANENARAQEGSGMGAAFGSLAKEGATTLLKTAILSPFQGMFGALAGTKDGSSQDRALWVRDANSKGPLGSVIGGADSKEGGKGKDTAGGILDETIQDAEGFFSSIGDGFSGIFSTISGWASTAWNVISGLFSSGSGSGGGSIWGSLLGGAMGMFGFANGGHVKGPGTGTSDSIPAWLSNGEYVLTSREVDAIGVKNIERWKEAMKSPAKFSTGGLVSTFESASRNMAKSSNISDTGSTPGGTVINVIDQRSAANSSPVETTKSRGPDGKDMISIMVKDAVKNAINSGALDRTMAANYGSRRMGGSR